MVQVPIGTRMVADNKLCNNYLLSLIEPCHIKINVNYKGTLSEIEQNLKKIAAII